MKFMPFILVVLLPSVMLASVVVSSAPASVDNYLSMAREALEDGNYITAFALYECALQRDPHSLEAFAGRLIARASMKECSTMQIQLCSN